MTVHVAGLWELGYNVPLLELDLWQFMLRDFGVEKFYMTPITGIDSGRVTERASIQEILDEHDDFQVVFVDERASVPLQDFIHPENALYVFGKANFSPFLGLKREGDLELRLDTVLTRGLLWPHQCAAIILYDRIRKCQ